MNQIDLIEQPPVPVDVRDKWQTPVDLFALLDSRYHFIIDLAASRENAKCERCFTEEDDCTVMSWPRSDEGWCFLNPPFSQMALFMAKVHDEHRLGSNVVVVMPGHRHEQGWFHRYVLPVASKVMVPFGRIAYYNPDGVKKSSPEFPSFVVEYNVKCNARLVMEML